MGNFDKTNDSSSKIRYITEPHLAVLFLIDTSKPMGLSQKGEVSQIYALNEGLSHFKSDVCKDDSVLRKILDFAIIGFNDTYRVIQEFCPIEVMEPVTLVSNGSTVISPAIKEALKIVHERKRFYNTMGTPMYKPWIILISNGDPQDDITAVANEIRDKENNLHFIILGIPGYKPETMEILSGHRVMKLVEKMDFSGYFKWLRQNFAWYIRGYHDNCERPPDLPENIAIDYGDWDR